MLKGIPRGLGSEKSRRKEEKENVQVSYIPHICFSYLTAFAAHPQELEEAKI